MSFLHPNILWLLLLPMALAAATLLMWRRRSKGWQVLVSALHRDTLVTQHPAWRTILPATLALLALACTITALARPINGFREGSARASGRNLIIALDISRSMETQDVKPSRLEEARAAAYELIRALPADKIGLMVFSGEADLVVPLTYDHTALMDALEQVNRGWAGAGGTNFGLVLRKAMQDFTRSAPDGTNALVILSDGEDTVESSLETAEQARKNNLLVITVGIGTPTGGAIPDAQGENGLWQDADGKHVISKLRPESLQQFAQATGGDYFLMTVNANLADFARRAVEKLDRHEEAYSLNKIPNDLFQYFALAALLLVIAAILCVTEWRRMPRVAAGLLLLALGAAAPGARAAVQPESMAAYKQGLQLMQNAAGNAEAPAAAREAFSRALLDEDPHMQAASLHALGNLNTGLTLQELRALYQPAPAAEDDEDAMLAAAPGAANSATPESLQRIVDKLKQDITAYSDALAIRPDLAPAQTNKKRIEELIKKLEEEIERLKQQQQQQQQDNQQNQENRDNQQQQDQQQNQDNKDNKQDQQDSQQQNPENQDDPQQDNPQDDQQNKQDPQDKQDNQDNQQGQQDPQQQNQDQQQQPQQPKEQPQQQQPQQQQPQPQSQEPSDEEKAKQRAAAILQMHLDEEKGSPIPHFNDNMRPPRKDY